MRYGYHRYARKVFLGALHNGSNSRSEPPKKLTKEEEKQNLIAFSLFSIIFLVIYSIIMF